jgi:hypothetical protein
VALPYGRTRLAVFSFAAHEQQHAARGERNARTREGDAGEVADTCRRERAVRGARARAVLPELPVLPEVPLLPVLPFASSFGESVLALGSGLAGVLSAEVLTGGIVTVTSLAIAGVAPNVVAAATKRPALAASARSFRRDGAVRGGRLVVRWIM